MTDAEIINTMITEQENKETIRRGEAAAQKAAEDAIADIEQRAQEGILQSNSELGVQGQQDSVIPPMETAAPKSEEPIDTEDVARQIGARMAQKLTQEEVSDEAEGAQETAVETNAEEIRRAAENTAEAADEKPTAVPETPAQETAVETNAEEIRRAAENTAEAADKETTAAPETPTQETAVETEAGETGRAAENTAEATDEEPTAAPETPAQEAAETEAREEIIDVTPQQAHAFSAKEGGNTDINFDPVLPETGTNAKESDPTAAAGAPAQPSVPNKADTPQPAAGAEKKPSVGSEVYTTDQTFAAQYEGKSFWNSKERKDAWRSFTSAFSRAQTLEDLIVEGMFAAIRMGGDMLNAYLDWQENEAKNKHQFINDAKKACIADILKSKGKSQSDFDKLQIDFVYGSMQLEPFLQKNYPDLMLDLPKDEKTGYIDVSKCSSKQSEKLSQAVVDFAINDPTFKNALEKFLHIEMNAEDIQKRANALRDKIDHINDAKIKQAERNGYTEVGREEAAPAPTPAPTIGKEEAAPAPTPAPTMGREEAAPAPTPAPTMGREEATPAPTPALTIGKEEAVPAPTPTPTMGKEESADPMSFLKQKSKQIQVQQSEQLQEFLRKTPDNQPAQVSGTLKDISTANWAALAQQAQEAGKNLENMAKQVSQNQLNAHLIEQARGLSVSPLQNTVTKETNHSR